MNISTITCCCREWKRLCKREGERGQVAAMYYGSKPPLLVLPQSRREFFNHYHIALPVLSSNFMATTTFKFEADFRYLTCSTILWADCALAVTRSAQPALSMRGSPVLTPLGSIEQCISFFNLSSLMSVSVTFFHSVLSKGQVVFTISHPSPMSLAQLPACVEPPTVRCVLFAEIGTLQPATCWSAVFVSVQLVPTHHVEPLLQK